MFKMWSRSKLTRNVFEERSFDKLGTKMCLPLGGLCGLQVRLSILHSSKIANKLNQTQSNRL